VRKTSQDLARDETKKPLEFNKIMAYFWEGAPHAAARLCHYLIWDVNFIAASFISSMPGAL